STGAPVTAPAVGPDGVFPAHRLPDRLSLTHVNRCGAALPCPGTDSTNRNHEVEPAMTPSVAPGREPLFRPLSVRSLALSNRLVMTPMTRMGCPGGLPDEVNRDYYAARAAGGTGLVVTEGIGVDHPSSVDHSGNPRLDTPESVAAWRVVTDAVHAAGGRIIAQLWHVGPLWGA